MEIYDLHANPQEQGLIIAALRDELRKLKGKAIVNNTVTTHTNDPEMLKVNVELIAPRLLNNRTIHSDYLRLTQEQAAILREVVKQGKSLNPLNNSLDHAYNASGPHPSGNTKKDKIQRPPSSTQKNEVEAHPRTVKYSLKNKNHAVEPKGNATVQHSKLKNLYVLNVMVVCFLIIMILGNECPLTRITTTTAVPSRKPISLETNTPKPVVTLVYSRKPKKSKTTDPVSRSKVVQIILWYLDFGCSKHMTRDRSQLTSFVNKCLSNVKFGNDHVEKIMGYGDYQIGNVTISRVYYVEGLGVDLLTRSRGNNLYTLSLRDMMASSPICFLSKASKTKSWLWNRRLSHLKFVEKSKKKPYKPKSENTNQEKHYLLHMNLCGPMRVASVNGNKYILVIVDDYSRFTSVKCLRTDNGTEVVNQTLHEYYEKVGISHETSVSHSPQQNGVVERRNCTLIDAAHTMLIYAKAPLFLLAEAVTIACYTQNRFIIRLRHCKTPYELLHDKLHDLSFFHVLGALCYPTNDNENLEKLQPKAGIGIFIGYAPTKKAFRICNRRTRRITETIHVDFDELTAMASEHSSSGPALHEMTPATISSGLVPNPPPSTPYVPPSRIDWHILFQPQFDELLTPPPSVDLPAPEVIALISEVVAPEPTESTGSPSKATIDQDAPSPSNSQTTHETQSHVISNDVEKENHDLNVAHMNNDPFFGILILDNASESSSLDVIPTVVHTATPNSKHIYKVKLDELGGILKNKARLVARGYHQEKGIDFEESFAPSKYAIESLKKYGMESSNPVDTLMVEKSKLDEDSQGKAVNPTHYRGMVETLMYLIASRLDLTFDVCMYARYQAKPTEKHLHAVKRIFKYLRGIVNKGRWYLNNSSIALTTYADADHVGC
nr:hypothetical protein [Tanacetum cinerariifolium]